jgi:hypothetical protein
LRKPLRVNEATIVSQLLCENRLIQQGSFLFQKAESVSFLKQLLSLGILAADQRKMRTSSDSTRDRISLEMYHASKSSYLDLWTSPSIRITQAPVKILS